MVTAVYGSCVQQMNGTSYGDELGTSDGALEKMGYKEDTMETGRVGKTSKRSRYAARGRDTQSACNESEEKSQQCMEAAIKVYKDDTKIKTEVGRNGKTNQEDGEMVNGKW